MTDVDAAAGSLTNATQRATMVARPPSPSSLRLVAVAGPGKGAVLVLRRAMGTIGRHDTNDLVVPDPLVSGVHLEVRVEGRVLVRDLGSRNGTWVGPVRIVEAALEPGAELRVGETVLRLEQDDGAHSALDPELDAFGGLVARSRSMRQLFAQLARIAPKDIGVLVQGETGTGKEEIARALHAQSKRREAPFVVIDATSLPEALVESLLFGHEKGAFTGADRRHTGLFEAAQGGTVFIDEIGELPAALQSKFLRVLERQEFVRVGGHVPVKVNVRVIAATHRDLRQEVEAGRFREDLFYRLAQLHVFVPPLRARPEDVELLVERFLASDEGPSRYAIEPDALAYLTSHPWPGNVRQLRNAMIRAAALTPDGVVRRPDVVMEADSAPSPLAARATLDLRGSFVEAKERAIEAFETAYLGALMRRSRGNLTAAAKDAGIARNYLRDRLRKWGLYDVGWGDEERPAR